MTKSETIEVRIDHESQSRLVGRCCHITKARGSTSVFEYDDAWLAYDGAFALDPANLPFGINSVYRSAENSALPGALRDTAPDSWGRRLISRAFHKSGEIRTLTEIDYLLGMNDQARIGALRFKREDEPDFDRNIGGYLEPPLIRLPALLNAADAVQSESETSEDLKLLLNKGSPLGGARPKSAIVDKNGMLAIAKFPSPNDDRSIPHGEVLALALAERAGLNAASARLEMVAERPVALIRRFDRDGEQRIPFLSAMSLLNPPEVDEATYTDIAECIRMYSSAPIQDLHELWRRMVFSVKIGNLDDHLRNHGFLYGGDGKWRLSPAYDLNPVPLKEKLRELTTWISEEGPEANIDQAYRAAPYFALKNGDATRIVDTVASGIKGWQDIARKLGMSKADIEVYATAITIS